MIKLIKILFFLNILGYLEVLPFPKPHYLLTPILVLLSITQFKRMKIDIPVIIFLLIFEIQSIFAYIVYYIFAYEDFRKVLLSQIAFVGNILIYHIAFSIYDLDEFVKMLKRIGLIYAFFSLYDIYNSIFSNLVVTYIRYRGTLDDPNYLCLALIMFNSIFAYSFIKERLLTQKFLALLVLILNTIVILLTFSRSGILGLIVFILSLIIASFKNRSVFVFITIYLTAFLSVMFVLFYFNKNLYVLMYEMVKIRLTREAEIEAGFSRINEIRAGFNFFVENFPISVLGMGFGSSTVTEFFRAYSEPLGIRPINIHNTFFGLLFECGLLSLVAFIYLAYRSIKYILILDDRQVRAIYIGLFFSTIFISMFINTLHFLPFYIAFLAIPKLCNQDALNKFRT